MEYFIATPDFIQQDYENCFQHAISLLCNRIPDGKTTLAQQLKGYDFQNTIISKGIQISVGWFFTNLGIQIELFVQY